MGSNLFNLKNFVSSEEEASEFLGASGQGNLAIDGSGKIQQLIVDALSQNSFSSDIFHVALKRNDSVEISDSMEVNIGEYSATKIHFFLSK